MAEKQKKPYLRNPYPEVYTENDCKDNVFATGVDYPLEYQNLDYETSEIKKIVLKCPPLVQITVQRDGPGGTKTMVHETVYASDVDYCIYFKGTATDKTLTLGRGKKLYITMRQDYGSNQQFTLIIDKDQLLWKPPEEKK